MRLGSYSGVLALAAPAMGAVWEEASFAHTWSMVDRPTPESTITLSIALARSNLDKLEATLNRLATPGQATYGQWLDKADIDTLFPVADHQPVMRWLAENGITKTTRSGSLLHFTSTVDQANKLLGTDFAYYQHGGSTKLRTTQYSIPAGMTSHIETITPTVYFGKSDKVAAVVSNAPEAVQLQSQSTVDSSCESIITPTCLKEMYNVGDYTPDPSSGSWIGFASFLNQSAQYSDLEQFEQLFNIPSQSFSVETINGGVNDQNATIGNVGEADLDVENIVGLSHPLPVLEYITGGVAPFIPDADEPTQAADSNEPYMIYWEYLLQKNNSEIPQVLSHSYGDDEQTVPRKYAKRVCDLIGLNSLRGITILHSSGDEGVGSACQAVDGTTPQFNPIFPATCPYLTSVGGTSDVAPETAWNASSGGFSNFFPRAAYQKSAVQTYLDGVPASTKAYYSQYTNFGGRGFPDISAHSLYPRYEVIYTGRKYGSGGTSAAAPVVAALVAMLNDARLRAGKPTLGFLNPFLYSTGYTALNDITEGGSYGCTGIDPQTGGDVTQYGGQVIPGSHWNATVGWDPVTGLGTPDFQALKNLVLAM